MNEIKDWVLVHLLIPHDQMIRCGNEHACKWPAASNHVYHYFS